jgi:hypothetical protein
VFHTTPSDTIVHVTELVQSEQTVRTLELEKHVPSESIEVSHFNNFSTEQERFGITPLSTRIVTTQ